MCGIFESISCIFGNTVDLSQCRKITATAVEGNVAQIALAASVEGGLLAVSTCRNWKM